MQPSSSLFKLSSSWLDKCGPLLLAWKHLAYANTAVSMATTTAVLHLFWRWNNGTDHDGVTFMNRICSLARVRSIKQTYMHLLVLWSLFLTPMLETLWWLQIHCWPTWRQNKVRTGTCWYPCLDVIYSAAVPESDEQWVLQKTLFLDSIFENQLQPLCASLVNEVILLSWPNASRLQACSFGEIAATKSLSFNVDLRIVCWLFSVWSKWKHPRVVGWKV